jgi:hypothetical protein
MRVSIAALLCLAALGCTRAEPRLVTAPLPAEGKPTAPVTVSAKLGPSLAQVTLRFESAATDVTAGVSGLDGLQAGPAPALPRAAYAAGETASLDVPLGSPSGTLAVFVGGTFGGRAMGRSVTFTVGTPPARARAADGDVVPTDLGPVKAMPAAVER